MLPTSLPELPKPSRTLGKSQKHVFIEPEMLQKKYCKKTLHFLLIPFVEPIGGTFLSAYRLSF